MNPETPWNPSADAATLLDLFASDALVGLLKAGNEPTGDHSSSILAHRAYTLAEAMLHERATRRQA